MKCPLRIDSQGNASDCYKNECAWWWKTDAKNQ